MATEPPEIISGTNVSHVWAKAFLLTMDRSDTRVPPLLVSVGGFQDGAIQEDLAIKQLVDKEMEAQGIPFDSDEVAFTIFPHSYWNPGNPPDRTTLFKIYGKAYPRLLRRSDANHRRGTYFQRLTNFEVYSAKGREVVNQLDKILQIWNSSRRHSGLQACCFDPSKDHLPGPFLPFPCLQQVSFDFNGNGLSVNGFYAAQYMFKRAYGNYLGLCRLGQFMAHEMGLRLVRMNCFVGHASVGQKKTPLQRFADELRGLLQTAPPPTVGDLAVTNGGVAKDPK